MDNIMNYIESGIIELYVFGLATNEERKEVEKLATKYPDISRAISDLNERTEQFAMMHSVVPPPAIKPMVMATINYLDRLENGEAPSFPPLLNENSKIADYDEWLKRPEMTLPSSFTDFHARIIGDTSKVMTAIVWIKNLAPEEVHSTEYEKFLMVEGACNIIVDGTVIHLLPGDFFSVPLFKNHEVQVTSTKYCKAILQRVAA